MDIEQINAMRQPFLALPASTREALEQAYSEQLVVGSYSPGSDVPGYVGWRELPVIGVTSFIKDDDTLQYNW